MTVYKKIIYDGNNLCSVLIDDQLLHMSVNKERLEVIQKHKLSKYCLVVIGGRQLS